MIFLTVVSAIQILMIGFHNLHTLTAGAKAFIVHNHY